MNHPAILWITACGFSLALLPTATFATPMRKLPQSLSPEWRKDDRPAQVEIKLPPLEDQQPSITVDVEQEPPPQLELDDFDFWAEQCQQLVQAQQYEDGLNACNEALAIDDTGDRTLSVWAARAEALIYQGEFVDALISLEQVLTEDTTNSLLITQQCVAYTHSGLYEDAVDSCETALMINGNWGQRSPAFAWYYRGIALQAQGFLETSLWSFERAVRSATNVGSAEETQPNANESAELIQTLGLTSPSPEPLGHAEWCHTLHLLGQERQAFAEQSSLEACDLDDTIAYYEQAANLYPQDIILRLRQGLALEQLGDYTRALAAYEQGLGVASDHPQLLARKCSMLNQLDRYEEALAACELALESPQPQPVGDMAHALNQYSLTLIGLERYEDALATAERAIATHPTYGPAYTSKAVSLWHLGRNDDALAQAQTTLDIYEIQAQQYIGTDDDQPPTFYRPNAEPWPLFYRDYGIAYFNHGRILVSRQQRPSTLSPLTTLSSDITQVQSLDIGQVQAAYEDALRQPIQQLDVQWPDRLGQPGQSNLAGQGRTLLEIVEALWEPVSDQKTLAILTPDRFIDTLLNLSAVFMETDPEQALILAQIATTLNPDSFIGWYNMAIAARAARKPEIAEYAFGVAQQLDPENPHVQLGIADSLRDQGKVDEAIAHYFQLLSQDPNDTQSKTSLLDIGERLTLAGDPQAAIALYTNVLAIVPNDDQAQTALLNVGNTFRNQGQRDAEVALYTHLLELDPTDDAAKDALLDMGEQFRGQGNSGDAISIFTHILILDPTYTAAKDAILAIGDAWLTVGNRGDAIATYDHVLNIDPNYRPAQEARAAALQPSS